MIISDDDKPWDLTRQFSLHGVSDHTVAGAYQAWREKYGDSPECAVVTPEQAAQLPLCAGWLAGVPAKDFHGLRITVPLSPRCSGWSLTVCIPVRITIPGPDMEPVGFAKTHPEPSALRGLPGPAGPAGPASTATKYTKTRWSPKYARRTT